MGFGFLPEKTYIFGDFLPVVECFCCCNAGIVISASLVAGITPEQALCQDKFFTKSWLPLVQFHFSRPMQNMISGLYSVGFILLCIFMKKFDVLFLGGFQFFSS